MALSLALAASCVACSAPAEQAQDKPPPIARLRDWLKTHRLPEIIEPAAETGAEAERSPEVPTWIPPITELPPVVVAPAWPEPVPPPKVVPRSVEREPAKRKIERVERETQAKQQEQPKQGLGCKPIAVNCSQVCEHAWMGEAAGIALGVAWGYCRPTPTQRAQGKACVRKYCPQYLNK